MTAAARAIRPRGPVDARVGVPGSKSITNRALPIAALAPGKSELHGALESDDTVAMRGCLAALGVRVEDAGDTWTVHGTGGSLAAPKRTLDAGASGTTARFVTALATLAPGPASIDGTPRMRERPIDDLVRALQALGARLAARGERGCPPVHVEGGGLPGGRAGIDASRSSQYVTAVLLAAPYAAGDVELSLDGGVLVSRPYVELTLEMMERAGAEVAWLDASTLRVRAGAPYRPGRFAIEPDASSAAYVFGAAAITGGRARVDGLPRDSLQADLGLLAVLEEMGCQVTRGDAFVEVQGPDAGLRAVDVDLNALPDQCITVAVLALFADGPSRIRNVGQVRMHETDRLAALEQELRRLGAQAETGPDWIRVEPRPLRGAEIATYDDHRMAMAFALAGLRIPDVAIADPGCVNKTWPDFFEALERL